LHKVWKFLQGVQFSNLGYSPVIIIISSSAISLFQREKKKKSLVCFMAFFLYHHLYHHVCLYARVHLALVASNDAFHLL